MYVPQIYIFSKSLLDQYFEKNTLYFLGPKVFYSKNRSRNGKAQMYSEE